MKNLACDQLDPMFSEITKILNEYCSSDVLQKFFFHMVESFFYANLIDSFFLSLTTQNLEVCGLSEHYRALISRKYKNIRKDAKSTIDGAPFRNGLIDHDSYDDFKRAVKQDFPEAFELISGIEKKFEIEEVRRYLKSKAEEIKKKGRSREDFNSLVITTAIEQYVKLRGYFPDRNLDKIFSAILEALPEMSGDIAESTKQNINQFLKKRRQKFQELEISRYARWQEPLVLFESQIRISEEVGKKHANKVERSLLKTNKAKFLALARIHARACQISHEVLTLLTAGYPDGANARWRTLNELAVVSLFLLKNNEIVSERYLDHDTVLKYKQAREYQDCHLKLQYSPIDEKVLENLKNETDRLYQKYGDEFKKDWGWIPADILPRQNFRALAAWVELDHLQPFFRLSSAAVHGLSRGFYRLGLTDDEQNMLLLCGPSNYGLADPLQSASISLNQITACLLNLQPDFSDWMELLVMDSLIKEMGVKAADIQKTIEREEAAKSK